MKIDNSIIEKLPAQIKDILLEELQAGNEVVEVYEDDRPCPNTIMVFLGKPFITPIQRNLTNIEFRNINDAHYWKAEYVDKKNSVWLCCKRHFKPTLKLISTFPWILLFRTKLWV